MAPICPLQPLSHEAPCPQILHLQGQHYWMQAMRSHWRAPLGNKVWKSLVIDVDLISDSFAWFHLSTARPLDLCTVPCHILLFFFIWPMVILTDQTTRYNVFADQLSYSDPPFYFYPSWSYMPLPVGFGLRECVDAGFHGALWTTHSTQLSVSAIPRKPYNFWSVCTTRLLLGAER
jgi:hypothetical protein